MDIVRCLCCDAIVPKGQGQEMFTSDAKRLIQDQQDSSLDVEAISTEIVICEACAALSPSERAQFVLRPPVVVVIFPPTYQPSAIVRRMLQELRPFITDYLVQQGRAGGLFFCDECHIQCTRFLDGQPTPGEGVRCVGCVNGTLS